MNPPSITRRGLVFGIGAGVGLGLMPGGFAVARPYTGLAETLPIHGQARAIVFEDRALFDLSGRLESFRPPAGARSCDGISALDEVTLRSNHFII